MEFLFAWLALSVRGTHLVQLNCIWIVGFILRKSVAVLLHLNLVYGSAGKLRTEALLHPAQLCSVLFPSSLSILGLQRQLAVLAGALCVQSVTWAVWEGPGPSSFHSFFSLGGWHKTGGFN